LGTYTGSIFDRQTLTGSTLSGSMADPAPIRPGVSSKGARVASSKGSKKNLKARGDSSLPSIGNALEVGAAEKTSQDKEIAKALVARAKSGDDEAFSELIRMYEKRAFGLALSLVSDPSEAEDIVQDAFLKAYRGIANFKGESGFYTWLYRIIFNLNIDYARKRARKKENKIGEVAVLDNSILVNDLGAKSPVGNVQGPQAAFESLELGEQLKSAIASLSSEHREVILLREMEGLSYAEISDVTNSSKGTVMSRLHHARKNLQKFLGEYVSIDK